MPTPSRISLRCSSISERPTTTRARRNTPVGQGKAHREPDEEADADPEQEAEGFRVELVGAGDHRAAPATSIKASTKRRPERRYALIEGSGSGSRSGGQTGLAASSISAPGMPQSSATTAKGEATATSAQPVI